MFKTKQTTVPNTNKYIKGRRQGKGEGGGERGKDGHIMATTMLEDRLRAYGWDRISLLVHRGCWDGLGGGHGRAGKEPDSEGDLRGFPGHLGMTPERQIAQRASTTGSWSCHLLRRQRLQCHLLNLVCGVPLEHLWHLSLDLSYC